MPRPRDQQPEYALVAQADGSQTIVALHAVQAGSTELSDEERRSLAAMLSNQRGQLEYQMHLDTRITSYNGCYTKLLRWLITGRFTGYLEGCILTPSLHLSARFLSMDIRNNFV